MPTTTQSKPDTSSSPFAIPSVEETTQRIRNLNERVIESTKTVGLVTLEAYEKSLKSLTEFEQKVAATTQLDWISAIANAHTSFVTDVSSSYTKAARDLLK
jgi:hypothetical protein